MENLDTLKLVVSLQGMEKQDNPYASPAGTEVNAGKVKRDGEVDILLVIARVIFVYTPVFLVLLMIVGSFLLMIQGAIGVYSGL